MKSIEIKKYRFADVVILTLVCALSGLASAYDESQQQEAESYYWEGVAFYSAENYSRAVDSFKKAYDLVPHAIIAYHLSAALSKYGRYHDTIHFAQQALTLEPPLESEFVADAKTLIDWAKDAAEKTKKISKSQAGVSATYDMPFPRPPEVRIAKPTEPTHRPTMVKPDLVKLRDEDSYHFLKKTKGKLSGGDFYFSTDDNGTAKFWANNSGQRGLVDLGDIGSISLDEVSVPEAGYYRFGIPAIAGHTYVSLARTNEESHVIVFRVKRLGKTATILQYIYR